ncbi:hypothetical protein SAMN05216299_10498 [Nitrosospira sp. Nsp14]|nr:hypothetical protein SAMN05216299_10498 [Nitrosospira sp. Nsp14]
MQRDGIRTVVQCFLDSLSDPDFFSAPRQLVLRSPGAPLCLILRNALLRIPFFNMFRLTFLLVGISGLVASWRGVPPFQN